MESQLDAKLWRKIVTESTNLILKIFSSEKDFKGRPKALNDEYRGF